MAIELLEIGSRGRYIEDVILDTEILIEFRYDEWLKFYHLGSEQVEMYLPFDPASMKGARFVKATVKQTPELTFLELVTSAGVFDFYARDLNTGELTSFLPCFELSGDLAVPELIQ